MSKWISLECACVAGGRHGVSAAIWGNQDARCVCEPKSLSTSLEKRERRQIMTEMCTTTDLINEQIEMNMRAYKDFNINNCGKWGGGKNAISCEEDLLVSCLQNDIR